MTLESIFSKIYLNPPSITFSHTPKKQTSSITITNYSDETIIYKMKSTRPDLFRMSPVYGIIEPRKEADVRLTFKGLLENQPHRNERFTVVFAISPSNETYNVRKLWQMQKEKDPTKSEIVKKKVQIVLATEHTETPTPEGSVPLAEDPDDDIIRAPKGRIRRKSRGMVEDDVGYAGQIPHVHKVPENLVAHEIVEENSFSGEEPRSRSESRKSRKSEIRMKEKSSRKRQRSTISKSVHHRN
ncbi:hypothetical protein RB195_016634 [Necator americanus]|uniref:Major sperm protein n=1 Tax=Necator americanus TaxID=51031 RepID=A0ABR1C1E0_NECAM